VEIGSLSSKEAYSADFKKHMYHSKENHLCYQLQHLEHRFPVKIELVFKGILLQINVFKMEKGSFCSKQVSSAELMKHMCLSNKTICVRTQSIWQIISM
jgi:hypothetical protein